MYMLHTLEIIYEYNLVLSKHAVNDERKTQIQSNADPLKKSFSKRVP